MHHVVGSSQCLYQSHNVGLRYGLDRCHSQSPMDHSMFPARPIESISSQRPNPVPLGPKFGKKEVGLAISQDEPPAHWVMMPRILEYLLIYFHEWAYMEPQRQSETGRDFKRRVYDALPTTSTAETKPWGVCIMQLQSAVDWSLVWGCLHNVMLPDGARSAWCSLTNIFWE